MVFDLLDRKGCLSINHYSWTLVHTPFLSPLPEVSVQNTDDSIITTVQFLLGYRKIHERTKRTKIIISIIILFIISRVSHP